MCEPFLTHIIDCSQACMQRAGMLPTYPATINNPPLLQSSVRFASDLCAVCLLSVDGLLRIYSAHIWDVYRNAESYQNMLTLLGSNMIVRIHALHQRALCLISSSVCGVCGNYNVHFEQDGRKVQRLRGFDSQRPRNTARPHTPVWSPPTTTRQHTTRPLRGDLCEVCLIAHICFCLPAVSPELLILD